MTDPDTKVLAIASHVVYGYVGNPVATFVLQTLGLQVSALNTVNFSNHTGYKQWKGTRVSANEILDLYEGLKGCNLDDFEMLLTGYIPGAEGVETVGNIGKEMKLKAQPANGKFFWVLDPVMGDEGNLYVSEQVVPVYKSLLPHADLITPNQFEAELISGITINQLGDLKAAVSAIHEKYKTPHVLISSSEISGRPGELVLAGSSLKSDGNPRHFMVHFPKLPGQFFGTGDMFASLAVARFREQALLADLVNEDSWMSPDDVPALKLPLARTAELALGTMYTVLARTVKVRDQVIREKGISVNPTEGEEKLVYMKAAELRLVQSWDAIRNPEEKFKAKEY